MIRLTERLRQDRPEVAFGADLIAGFPTETEAQFQETLDLVDQAGLSFLHVFPFSPRPGTPAARMPEVPQDTRKARARRLRAAGAAAEERLLARLVGAVHDVLVEHGGRGYTPHFALVRLAEDAAPGSVVRVRAEGYENGLLVGRGAA